MNILHVNWTNWRLKEPKKKKKKCKIENKSMVFIKTTNISQTWRPSFLKAGVEAEDDHVRKKASH